MAVRQAKQGHNGWLKACVGSVAHGPVLGVLAHAEGGFFGFCEFNLFWSEPGSLVATVTKRLG